MVDMLLDLLIKNINIGMMCITLTYLFRFCASFVRLFNYCFLYLNSLNYFNIYKNDFLLIIIY